MSTFAVFGMTRAVALKDAQKNTPTTKAHNGAIIQLTASEWAAECEKRADRVMAGKKVKQLSGMFDAPSTPSSGSNCSERRATAGICIFDSRACSRMHQVSR